MPAAPEKGSRYRAVLPRCWFAAHRVCMAAVRSGVVALAAVASVLALGVALAIATEEGRAPARVVDASAMDGGREVRLTVDTCKGNPEVDVVSQGPTEVVISVISDVQTGEVPACVDHVSFRLDEPIGDRDLQDRATGRRIWVPPSERR